MTNNKKSQILEGLATLSEALVLIVCLVALHFNIYRHIVWVLVFFSLLYLVLHKISKIYEEKDIPVKGNEEVDISDEQNDEGEDEDNEDASKYFLYCDCCQNNLLSPVNFVSLERGIETYKCEKCGTTSRYDVIHYGHPVKVD